MYRSLCSIVSSGRKLETRTEKWNMFDKFQPCNIMQILKRMEFHLYQLMWLCSTAYYQMRKIRCRHVYVETTLSSTKQNKILRPLRMFHVIIQGQRRRFAAVTLELQGRGKTESGRVGGEADSVVTGSSLNKKSSMAVIKGLEGKRRDLIHTGFMGRT